MKFPIFFILLKNYFRIFIAKLESEFKSIQISQEEQFEIQSKEIYSSHERIMLMAYDVDEIRRRLDEFQ